MSGIVVTKLHAFNDIGKQLRIGDVLLSVDDQPIGLFRCLGLFAWWSVAPVTLGIFF